jgi:hypothetical protein
MGPDGLFVWVCIAVASDCGLLLSLIESLSGKKRQCYSKSTFFFFVIVMNHAERSIALCERWKEIPNWANDVALISDSFPPRRQNVTGRLSKSV